MAAFEQIPDGGGSRDVPSTPFLAVGQAAIDVLESISAVDKAQAVPHLRIWEVDPHDGNPVNPRPDNPSVPLSPLTMRLTETPPFSNPLQPVERFIERPAVSLQRVSIKTENPRGVILYRQVELQFVVHRPDAVFEDPRDGRDSWSRLLLPGTAYVLEWGWTASTGVKNGILNGEGVDGTGNSPPFVVPGLRRIRFTVTNYNFTIQSNYEIAVHVQAIEDGELNMRRAGFSAPSAGGTGLGFIEGAAGATSAPSDPFSSGQDSLRGLQAAVASLRGDGHGSISFQELADSLFAPALDRAHRDLGYTDVRLVMGRFNHRCGRSSPRYGGSELSDRSIGEFRVPLDEVKRIYGQLRKAGVDITLYNFLTPFLTLFRDVKAWDRRDAKVDELGVQLQRIPEVCLKTLANRGTVVVYLFDINREVTRFTERDRDFGSDPAGSLRRVPTAELRQKLASYGVPFISFQRANSYLADASFEVHTDDQIRSIFVNRYMGRSRQDIVSKTDVSRKATPADGRTTSRAPDPRQVLYTSAIKGDVTMLGNFAFDVFALVWLDFGVPIWSGTFFIASREDVIEPGEFSTRISFYATGDDPLGTQGRAQVARSLSALRR